MSQTSELHVLIVDDDEKIRHLLTRAVSPECQAAAVATGEAALDRLAHRTYDLVLLDHGLPGLDGLEVLREIKKRHPETGVVMVTARNEISMVVACVRAGADDYIPKPIVPETIRHKIRALRQRRDLATENRHLRAELDQRSQFDEMIGESPAFVTMLGQLERVTGLDIAILIQGESGTGKELVARAVHRNSPRRQRAFLSINCAALQDSLLASELFGHEKGAFTDAREAKKGLFVEADGGTLFLDEIGEISPRFQAQLLRVLQNGEITPVGSSRSRSVNVRVVTATNRELKHEVDKGRFRHDLYYRLLKFPIRVPALRERPDDIARLAEYFLKRYSSELKKRIRGFSPSALRYLEGRAWPGNIRELENVIERSVILADGNVIERENLTLEADHGPGDPGDGLFEGEWKAAKLRFEAAYVGKTLQASGGNISEAARLAGIDRRNFRHKIQAHGIDPAKFR